MNKPMLEASMKNRVVRANFDILVRGTTADRESIAHQCYARDLIPTALINARMPQILHTIKDRITTDASGHAFELFCNILREDRSTAHLADLLDKALDGLRKAFEQERSLTTLENMSGNSVISHDRVEEGESCTCLAGMTSPPSIASNPSSSKDKKSKSYTLEVASSDNSTETSTEEEEEDRQENGRSSVGENREAINLGRISSVTHIEFPSLHIPKYENEESATRDTCISTTRQRSFGSITSDPSSHVQEITEAISNIHLTGRDDKTNSTTERNCCEHLKELHTLRNQRMNENGLMVKLFIKKHALHVKLRSMKRERRKQRRKTKELEVDINRLQSVSKAQTKHSNQHFQQLLYMEAYCNEARAENIRLQHQLLYERQKAFLLQKQAPTKKEFSGMKGRLSLGLEEGKREKESLEEKVKDLEKLVERLKQGGGGSGSGSGSGSVSTDEK